MSLINELIINGINSNKFKKILFIHQLLMQQRCGKKIPGKQVIGMNRSKILNSG